MFASPSSDMNAHDPRCGHFFILLLVNTMDTHPQTDVSSDQSSKPSSAEET